MLTDIYKDFMCLRMTLPMVALRHMPLEMHHAIKAPISGAEHKGILLGQVVFLL